MKWYKKQLDELKKNKPELAKLGNEEPIAKEKNQASGKVVNKTFVHNPVKLRNVNRPKTDA